MYIIVYSLKMFVVINFFDHFNYVFFVFFIFHVHPSAKRLFAPLEIILSLMCLSFQGICKHLFDYFVGKYVDNVWITYPSIIYTLVILLSYGILKFVRELGHLFVIGFVQVSNMDFESCCQSFHSLHSGACSTRYDV